MRRGAMPVRPDEELRPEELVSVTLVCLVCGIRRTIHVSRSRRLPAEIAWECFECQGKDCGRRAESAPTGPDRRGCRRIRMADIVRHIIKEEGL